MKILPLLFLLLSPSILYAQASWTTIAALVQQSTVYVESVDGSCTGFVSDAERDLVVTAAHCDGEKLYVDQVPATVVAKDSKHDLLVLFVKDIGDDRPALRLAKRNPEVGETVASLGHGYGYERPMFLIAHVADDDTYIPEDGIGGPLIVVDAAFVPGQSGGPVVNQVGEVVMIVQMSNDRVALGRGAEDIKKHIGKYFAN